MSPLVFAFLALLVAPLALVDALVTPEETAALCDLVFVAPIPGCDNIKCLNPCATACASCTGDGLHISTLGNADWSQITSLPTTFPALRWLDQLTMNGADQLTALVEDFGNLTNLKMLNIPTSDLSTLPASIGSLTALEYLSIRSPSLSALPDSFWDITSLTYLYLGIPLDHVPNKVENLIMLQYLAFFGGEFPSLPETLGTMGMLTTLEIYENQNFVSLPQSIGSLSLQSIRLQDLPSLQRLPDSFGSLSFLERLEFYHLWNLTALPSSFGSLSMLTSMSLSFSGTAMPALPDSFGGLSALKSLELPGMHFKTLPESFGSLSSLGYLDLSTGELESLPDSFGDLQLHTVYDGSPVTLYLDNNKLTALPNSFNGCVRPDGIAEIKLNNNKLARLPDTFMENLTVDTVTLYDNLLTELPPAFGENDYVQRINLHGNKLSALPDSFEFMYSLTYLDLSSNEFTEIPEVLYYLPLDAYVDLNQNCVNCTEASDMDWPCSLASRCLPSSGSGDTNLSPSSNSGHSDEQLPPGGGGVGKGLVIGLAVGIPLLVCCIAAVVVTLLLLRKQRRKKANVSGVPMDDLSLLPIIDPAVHKITISPEGGVNFSASSAIPVDKEVHAKFKIVSASKKPHEVAITVPSDNPGKFAIKATAAETKLSKGTDIEVDLSLTLFCTTRLDTTVRVVLDGKEVIPVKVHAESMLSTKLDAEELDMAVVIGTGAFGTVFKGRWRDQEVAIKSYNQSIIEDPTLRGDIEREVAMCTTLRHPQVVSFFGSASQPGKFFLVMEFVSLGSLGAIVKKQPLELAFKVRVALDSARGMAFLHGNQIIHRDLKTDNVLVVSLDAKAPVVGKLSDFNTSRFLGSDANRTKTKGIGTPIFMAPEILEGAPYGAPADVYSFGMMLWNLWTQKEPYADFANQFAIFKFVQGGERLPLPDDLPEALKALTQRCWAHAPADRPEFKAIVQDLETIST